MLWHNPTCVRVLTWAMLCSLCAGVYVCMHQYHGAHLLRLCEARLIRACLAQRGLL